MAKIWFTCPQCGLQFYFKEGRDHLCPRCGHPMQLGRFKVQPRRTIPLPLPTPSGSFPQMGGSQPPMSGPMPQMPGAQPPPFDSQPTQPGQFTQAGWPPTQPPQPGRGQRPPFSSYSLPVRVATIIITVLIFVCVCSGIAYGIGQLTTSSATPTPGAQIAQGQTPRPTQAKPGATATAKPSPTSKPSPTATAKPSPTATATATPKPQPTATPRPQPTATNTPAPSCQYQAVNGNPWCYNFQCCQTIYSPPGNFCNYFNCISSFWNGNGYVEECQDGMYGKSGGISGSCSHHGGNLQPLYTP